MGGWPTTAFLTADGEVLAGATYVPPDQMKELLPQVNVHYRSNRDEVNAKVAEMRLRRAAAAGQESRGELSPQIFEQVLANFRASYFAGALLIPAVSLDADLRSLFARPAWDTGAFLRALGHYRATTEMLFYRLTERLPAAFGLSELFFLRFHAPGLEDRFELTKAFNMSHVPVPHGVDPGEHYCRRWAAMEAVRALRDGAPAPAVAVARAHFVNDGAEFFTLAAARPLALQAGESAVMLGVRADRQARRVVRFLNDPALPRIEVNLTCERCGIADCAVRAALPTVLHEERAMEERERALEELVG